MCIYCRSCFLDCVWRGVYKINLKEEIYRNKFFFYSMFLQVANLRIVRQRSRSMTKPTKLPMHPVKTQISLTRDFAVRMRKHWYKTWRNSSSKKPHTATTRALRSLLTDCTLMYVKMLIKINEEIYGFILWFYGTIICFQKCLENVGQNLIMSQSSDPIYSGLAKICYLGLILALF